MKTHIGKTIILDTTLRDGDQTPGVAFTRGDKIMIAAMLEKIGVDIIEAGFPASSQSQFDEVRAVSDNVQYTAVSAWARALPHDIMKAGKALATARKKYIHTSIPTSSIHREFKFKMTAESMLKIAVEAVLHARELADYVEIGAEDATRTDPGFLVEFCHAVTEAGADVVNISDTVGYAQPFEFGNLIQYLHQIVPAFQNGSSYLSVHCHNDLGLATANTLRGLEAGARQAEVTLLGLGERAGNAPLEEVVMALKVRNNYYCNIYTEINTEYFAKAARLISRLTGINESPIKPVTGRNAYSHSSGIHQNGMAAHPSTYSIISPEQAGYQSFDIVLSRVSGSSGFSIKIKELAGIVLAENELNAAYVDFKLLAEAKGTVSSTDLLSLLFERKHFTGDIWRLLGVKYSYDGAEAGNGFMINLSIINQHGAIKKMRLKDVHQWDTAVNALRSFFHYKMTIVDLCFSMAGDGTKQSGRFFITAEYYGKILCEESYGSDGIILCVHCFLGIINQIIAHNYIV